MSAQHGDVEEAYIVSREVKATGAGEVNERGGCGGESAVPHVYKFAAAGVSFLGLCENFFGFEVEETHAHGAIAHDAFEVANATASTEALLGIEGDRDVSTFPHAFNIRPATITDAIADGPHAGEFVELAASGGHAGSNGVG